VCIFMHMAILACTFITDIAQAAQLNHRSCKGGHTTSLGVQSLALVYLEACLGV
jgi:hypothetical protein